MPAYFDSSVVVKRYVRERDSEAAAGLLREYQPVSSVLLPIEISSALRRRRADLQARNLGEIMDKFRADREHWLLVEVTPGVLATAEALVESEGLRALDAMHVASATVAFREMGRGLPFITADREQAAAAKRLGLEVVLVR